MISSGSVKGFPWSSRIIDYGGRRTRQPECPSKAGSLWVQQQLVLSEKVINIYMYMYIHSHSHVELI